MRKHANLTAFCRTLPPDSLRALSRVAIWPGIEWSRVRLSIALHRDHAPAGIGKNGERLGPVHRGPVSIDDTAGIERQNPPIVGLFTERFPDVEGAVPTAELMRQFDMLNVERLPCAIPDGDGRRSGWCYVLTTHAGTQSERNAWLRAKEPPPPDNVVGIAGR